ncbi:Hsp20/alpha crystallin family protein [Dysosmobacter sp. HCP28S3_G4]|uniref:Hsp20/alpha crystallin family protein n=1 Tax=Dysosmobacter sp. HCP28S3_G4 TaxID=3438938 RepID=UPI003F11EA68
MLELRPYRGTFWDPFSDMEKRFFNDSTPDRRPAAFGTDITDEGTYFELKADLPGFRKEDIHLNLDGDTLTITAERHSRYEQREHQGKYIRCERSYGSYSRSFDVTGIHTEGIQAAYTDGVLTLKLPKQTAETPVSRRIQIN